MWFKSLLTIAVVIRAQAKEPELPLCPSNMQYFPQNLPMHCRMPATLPSFPPQMFPNPAQVKPGFPMPLPALPGPGANAVPGMPMPMPMMPVPQPPSQKLPVIVMPFYSPDTTYKKNPPLPPRVPHRKRKRPVKKRRPIRYDSSDEDSSDTDTSDDTSDDRGWWKKPVEETRRRSNRHHANKRKHNRDLLTPVLQYVTKDGYVIYEKKISKGEAKDWLVKKNTEAEKKEIPGTKIVEEHDSNEDRQGSNFNLIGKVEDAAEIKTDKNPQQSQKKKLLRRKPIKIIKENE